MAYARDSYNIAVSELTDKIGKREMTETLEPEIHQPELFDQ